MRADVAAGAAVDPLRVTRIQPGWSFRTSRLTARTRAQYDDRGRRGTRISTRALIVLVLGLFVLASCQPGASARSLPAPGMVAFPRCLAHDGDGNEVACSAPKRVYDGDSCVCGNGHGLAFYGRVQEYSR